MLVTPNLWVVQNKKYIESAPIVFGSAIYSDVIYADNVDVSSWPIKRVNNPLWENATKQTTGWSKV